MPYLGIIIVLIVLLVVAGIAFAFAMFKAQAERINTLEEKLGVSAVPFFKYVLSVLAAEITHPHEKYAELDALVAESLLEPEVRMSPERLARMDELLDKRAQDKSADMRPGEHQKALIVKQLVHLIRMERDSDIPLTGFTVVGSQTAEKQVSSEEK